MLKNILVLFLFTISIFASDLDAKIETLYKVPKEQRYKIMNEIKMELIKLNQSQRDMFVKKLLQHKEDSGKNHYHHQRRNRFKRNRECQDIGEKKHLHKHKFEHKKKDNEHSNKERNKNKQDKNKHNKPKHNNGKDKK